MRCSVAGPEFASYTRWFNQSFSSKVYNHLRTTTGTVSPYNYVAIIDFCLIIYTGLLALLKMNFTWEIHIYCIYD
jgi:hypothetical protein